MKLKGNQNRRGTMKKIILLAVALSLTASLAFAEKPDSTRMGNITLTITDLKNSEGLVVIVLFDSPKGFPGKYKKAVRKKLVPLKDSSSVKVEFKELPFGTYAFVANHDENKNKKLDTNLLGIPSEGVGVSNDAKGSMGPPKFEDSKFELNKKQLELQFKIRY